jgi:diamine N-acetyltransferase
MIRKATLADAQAILEIAEQTFRDTYTVYNTPENMEKYVAEKYTLPQISQEIEQIGVTYLLMEEGNDLTGYAKMIVNVPEELQGTKAIEIERIYVRKAFHGQKLGQELIENCCMFAKEQGFEVIWLGVWEKNEKALGFYKRMGFEIFGSHIFVLGNDEQHDYLMKMGL